MNIDMGKIALATKWLEESATGVIAVDVSPYGDNAKVHMKWEAHLWAFKKADRSKDGEWERRSVVQQGVEYFAMRKTNGEVAA